MNGMHSDWSLMMVAALFGKSASLRVMFFARVISYRRKCRFEPRFVKVCNAFASNLAKKRFVYEGAILMPIAFPCIVKSIVNKGEVAHSEVHVYEVTECFGFDNGSVMCSCVEEMTTCIDAFIV